MKTKKPVALTTGVAKKYGPGRTRINHLGNCTLFDRDHLPNPLDYYQGEFPNLRGQGQWRSVRCPFHDDHSPSLSINLVHGGFQCHGCGAKGGDVLAFQMLRYEQGFKEAALHFGALKEAFK